MMAYAQTYTVSPSGYTSVPSSNVTQGSVTFHGGLLQVKATVSGSRATFTLRKNDGSKFQNSGTYVIHYDSYSGDRVKTNIQVPAGSTNPSTDIDLNFSNGSKKYVITLKSGSIYYYTNPITITASSSSAAPTTPSSPSPSNGATSVATSGTLSWSCSANDGGSTLNYDLYMGTSTSNMTLYKSGQGKSCSYSGLSSGTKYYWKVVVYNGSGKSTQGDKWSFTTKEGTVAAPTTPSSPSPSNGATSVATSGTLSWSCSANDGGSTLNYDLYMGTSTSNMTLYKSGQGKSCSYSGLSSGTKYYWKVVVYNGSGKSTQGDKWSFTTKEGTVAAPTTPSSPSPSNGATSVATSGTLSWSCSANDGGSTLNYDLYMGTSTSNMTLYKSGQGKSCSYSGLSSGTKYYWKVVVYNGSGKSTQGDKWSFTTKEGTVAAPTTPSSPSPSNGATSVATSGTLSWSCSANDGGSTLNYDLYMGTSTSNMTLYKSGQGKSCSYSGLSSGTKYYWKVIVYNGSGKSTQGDKWSFTTSTSTNPPVVSDKYIVSPSGYTSVPTSNLKQGSVTFHGNLLQAKATVSGSKATFTLRKNDGSAFQNSGTYVIRYDSYSGTAAKTNIRIEAGSTNPSTDLDLDFTSGSKKYVITLKSGDIYYYTNPITITASSSSPSTQTANLVLASSLSFSTPSQTVSSMTKGQTYTFSVKVKNTGNTAWKGAFYLKNGSENWLSWGGQTIAAGSTITLTDTYRPQTTGSMSLDLFYQTGGTGSGILVGRGSYQNPLTINVDAPLATPNKNTFKAADITETSFTASWGAISGADCYDILVKKASAEDYSYYVFKRATSRTYITVTELEPNTSYQFQIRARNSVNGNSSNWSSSIPTAVKTKTETGTTTTANLSIVSINGFKGDEPLVVGEASHYSVYVINTGKTEWKGSFYLKDGKTDINPWYNVSISGNGGAKLLECYYTPQSTGTKSLLLYYQTGGRGDGIPVGAGKAKNPINVQVKEATIQAYDLKLKEAITCPTTIEWGNSTNIVAKVVNGSNSDWSGTLYLTEDKISIKSQHYTIKKGEFQVISANTWTPKTTGNHNISVYFKTDDETNMTQVGSNGFVIPVSVVVNKNDAPTTITEANLRLITKNCLPKEINEGDVAYCSYHITDKNGMSLKGIKAKFNCVVSGKTKVYETSLSDEEGYATLCLESSGDNAFAERGETATFTCTNLVDAKNNYVTFLNNNSNDGSFSLSIHQGNSFSRATGFEDVESFAATITLGASGKADIGTLVSASASASFPLTTTFKWKDGELLTEIQEEARADANASAHFGKYLDLSGGAFVGAKSSRTYNWKDPQKAALAILYSWIGLDQLYTNPKVLRSIEAIERWFGTKNGSFDEYFKSIMEAKENSSDSYYLGFSGGLNLHGFNKWPNYMPVGKGTLFPDLQIPANYPGNFNFTEAKMQVGLEASAKFEHDKTETNYKTNETLYGVGKELKIKVSGDGSETFSGLSPATPTLMNPIPKNSVKLPEGLYQKEYSTKLGATVNISMSAKEEEMYNDIYRTTLKKISNGLKMETGIKLSVGSLTDYLCPEWMKKNNTDKAMASAYIAVGMGYNWKMSSKGAWASYLQNLSENAETKNIASGIYPVFSDNYAINAPLTYFLRCIDEDKERDILNALNEASQTLDDRELSQYQVKDVLKIEQQESEMAEMKFSLPLAEWGPIEVTFDCGLSLGFNYYPSESYYSLFDKKFFPVVVRSNNSLASMCKKTTSFLKSKFNEAFGIEDKNEINEEYEKIGDKFEDYVIPDFASVLTNKNRQHDINPVSARIRKSSAMISQQLQKDICTFTYTLNDATQNFNEKTKVCFSHFYPAGALLGITDQNDTIFVISEVCDITALQGEDTLKTTQQGKIKLETTIGVDDLTPFGLPEDTPLDVYYLEEGSSIWSYVGPAGTNLMTDKLGSYMMGTSIKNDVINPEISMEFDADARRLLLYVSDNIAIRTKSLTVYVNGEAKDLNIISESSFEVQLNPEDMAYRLDISASVYDLAGNIGLYTQTFQFDKPAKVNIADQPDTDISQLDNTIYVEPLSVTAGNDVTLSVKMKNNVEAEGFQFDLELPEGVSVVKDADGYAEAYLSTERTTARKTNTFDTAFLENGSLRVIAGSTNGSTISGDDGEVASIKLKIDKSVTAGSYPIVLRNIAISDANAVSHDVAYVKSTLTIDGGLMGDANHDGVVNVFDVTAMVNYILGSSTGTFMFEAADVNADGIVNVFDVTKVVNIILGVDAGAKRRVAMREAGKGIMSAVIDGNEMYLVVDDAPQYVAMQFDVVMPEGTSVGDVELNNAAGHMLSYRQIDENHYRVIAYSLQNAGFKPTEKALVCMKQATGANIENAMLVTTDGRCINMNVKDEATGIDPVDVRNERKAIYNLSGQYMGTDVNSLPKGIYIRNKQKVYIK